MKFEQIQSLMNYGFTPDQIIALARDEPIPPAEPAPDPEPSPSPDPVPPPPEPEAPPAPAPESPPAPSPEIESLREEIKKLTATIQSQNIRTLSVDKISDPEAETDKIMAEFIRPTFEKKEK
jgi:hypothetical protein